MPGFHTGPTFLTEEDARAGLHAAGMYLLEAVGDTEKIQAKFLKEKGFALQFLAGTHHFRTQLEYRRAAAFLRKYQIEGWEKYPEYDVLTEEMKTCFLHFGFESNIRGFLGARPTVMAYEAEASLRAILNWCNSNRTLPEYAESTTLLPLGFRVELSVELVFGDFREVCEDEIIHAYPLFQAA